MRRAALGLLLLLLACGAGAAEDLRVLVLQSYQRDFSWSSSLERGIEGGLRASGLPVALFVEYLDAKRGESAEKLAGIEEAFRLKYGGLRFDCLIAVDNAALAFLNERASRLFPGSPAVFCGINGWEEGLASGLPEATGIIQTVDYLGTVELALGLLPGLRRLVLLSDYSSSGRLIASDARAQISAARPALELLDPPDLPAEALPGWLGGLGPDSALLFLAYVVDGAGRVWKPAELASLLEGAGLPIFTSQDSFFEPGVIGGVVTRGEDQGRETAGLAARILRGEAASSIPPGPGRSNRPVLRWEELRRQGLLSGVLPEGVELQGRPLSFVEREPRVAIGIGLSAFLLLAVLLLLAESARSHRAARLAVEASEERLRHVIEATSDAIWDIDFSTRDVFVSRRWCEIVGMPPEELPMSYEAWEALVLPEDRPLAVGAIARAAAAGERSYRVEYRVRARDGGLRWILERGRLVSLDAQGRPLRAVGAFSDVTARREAQARLEAQARELADKNEELERFTYTVSHDLKSPLITIKGFLSFLAEDFAEGQRARFDEDLERISRAADRMQELLGDLLELSRIGRLGNPPARFSAGEAVELALENLEGLILARRAEIERPESWPEVLADRPRLAEVFQNLIENAIKYSGPEGPRVLLGWEEAEEGYRFFVRDSGIGLDPAYAETVFGLFNKLDPRSEGTGIGLALVRRIAELHGGRAWAESEGPGRGSTFWFSLPRPPE